MVGDELRGAGLTIPQLGVLMDIAPPRDDFRHDLVDAPSDRGGLRAHGGRGKGSEYDYGSEQRGRAVSENHGCGGLEVIRQATTSRTKTTAAGRASRDRDSSATS